MGWILDFVRAVAWPLAIVLCVYEITAMLKSGIEFYSFKGRKDKKD